MTCRYCQRPLVGRKPQTKYCNPKCQSRWHEREYRRQHGYSLTTGRLGGLKRATA